MDTPLIAAQLKPAPQLIQTLLADILVQCQTCRKEIRAGEYGTHKCEVEPHSSADDMQTVTEGCLPPVHNQLLFLLEEELSTHDNY